MLNASELQDCLDQSDPGLDVTTVYFPKIDSTMNAAKDLEDSGVQVSRRTLFLADDERPTGNSGKWIKNDGDIAFTYVVENPRDLREHRLFSMAICIAVIDAIETSTADQGARSLYYKWPNDVYDIKGRKLCGVLTTSAVNAEKNEYLEAHRGLRISQNWMQLGVGINVTRKEFEFSSGIPSTSVEELCPESPKNELLVANIIRRFHDLLSLLETHYDRFAQIVDERLYVDLDRSAIITVTGLKNELDIDRLSFAATHVATVSDGFILRSRGASSDFKIPFDQIVRMVPGHIL